MPAADRARVGDAAAVPDHDRGRAARAPQAPVSTPTRRLRKPEPASDSRPTGSMSSSASRDACAAVVVPLAGTEAGRKPLEMGAGGDRTMELDRAAEAIVLDELRALADGGEHSRCCPRRSGCAASVPHSARRRRPRRRQPQRQAGHPVLQRDARAARRLDLGTTVAGRVVNIANGERWTASKARGPSRDGERLHAMPGSSDGRIDLLGLESSTRSLKAAAAAHRAREQDSHPGLDGALDGAHRGRRPRRLLRASADARLRHDREPCCSSPRRAGVATDLEGESLDGLRVHAQTRTTFLCAPTALAIRSRSKRSPTKRH